MSRAKAGDSERHSRTRLRWLGPAIALASILGVQSLRFVLTPSLPRGVYLALPPARPYHAGDIVAFCPPLWIARVLLQRHLVAPGPCPGGSVPLAKRVAAIGAFACAGPAGLALNGHRFPWPVLPKSLLLSRYAGCGPTRTDCAFLFGDGPDSVDSRVFGCVPTGTLRGRLLPLLTEGRLP